MAVRQSNKPVRANKGTQVKGATPKSFMTNPARGRGSTNKSVPFTVDQIPVKSGKPHGAR